VKKRSYSVNQATAWLQAVLSLRWIRGIWMYIIRILERMDDNHIFLSAAGIAFNILLCFIPLVLLVFYVLAFYLDTSTAIATIDSYMDKLQLFPFQRDQLMGLIRTTLSEFVRGSGVAGIVGLVGLLWTSSALFAALRTVLNRIYHFKDKHNVFISKLKDFAMLSVVGVVLVIVMAASNMLVLAQELGQRYLGTIMQNWFLHGVMIHVVSGTMIFFAFMILFGLLPDRRLPFVSILISSFTAAVLWELAKVLVAYYLSNLWSMGHVYGSYSILIAVALYLYYSSVTLLFAAEIGQMHIERRYLKKLFREKELRNAAGGIAALDLEFPTPATPAGSGN
jgi:YihY family inner membrane protein